jgi:F-box/leucine-rich repeat protein 10/11
LLNFEELRVRDIEIATRVPKKFRFPLFSKCVRVLDMISFSKDLVRLSWYVGEKFLRDLRAKEEFPTRVLESVEAVARFLVSQARDLERGPEAARREAREQVPADRVKDPSAVARELRWRARLALEWESDLESADGPKSAAEGSDRSTKRNRPTDDKWEVDAQFRNFQPKAWQFADRKSEQRTERKYKARPMTDNELLKGEWLEDVAGMEVGSSEEVTITSRKMVTTKVRKTMSGIERQRVESVIEKWEWTKSGE